MKNRSTVTVIVILVVALALSGCGGSYTVTKKGTAEPVYTATIRNIDDDVMPIAGFMGPNNFYVKDGYKYPSTIRDDVYAKLQKAGINLIIEHQYDLANIETDAELQLALELAEKYGINYVLSDSKLLIDYDKKELASQEVFDAEVALYREYKAISGFNIKDEPVATHFDFIKTVQERFYNAVEKTDISYTTYTNLFGAGAGGFLAGDESNPITYREYVTNFAKTNPPYLMYDLYPFVGTTTNAVHHQWFETLALYLEISNTYEMPYWLWLQAGGQHPDYGNYRIPTEAELLWSINTSLALGAKGLGYFPLCLPQVFFADPYPSGLNTTNNENSLINQFGTTTPAYNHAVKAATQIQAVDEVLMKSKCMGLIANGESPSPIRGNYVLSDFRQLKSVAGGDAVVGCFDYKGGTALYVVNNSIEDKNTVSLSFDDTYGFDVTLRGKSDFVSGKNLSIKLEAGEGALITLR